MVDVDEFIQLSDEMVEFCLESQEIDYSLEIYNSLNTAIKECGGISKSLEVMFGENFTSVASMEEESSAQEEGWWKRLWNWIKDFFARCWAWLKSWFQTRDGMIEKLNELKGKADQVKYPVRLPVSLVGATKAASTLLYFNAIRHLDIEKLTVIGLTDSIGRILGIWESIKAKFQKDYKEYVMVENSKDLIEQIEFIIDNLERSKYISEHYKDLSDMVKSKAKDAGHGDVRAWIEAKHHLIQMFLANQSFFRILIRMGNLILQRSKFE